MPGMSISMEQRNTLLTQWLLPCLPGLIWVLSWLADSEIFKGPLASRSVPAPASWCNRPNKLGMLGLLGESACRALFLGGGGGPEKKIARMGWTFMHDTNRCHKALPHHVANPIPPSRLPCNTNFCRTGVSRPNLPSPSGYVTPYPMTSSFSLRRRRKQCRSPPRLARLPIPLPLHRSPLTASPSSSLPIVFRTSCLPATLPVTPTHSRRPVLVLCRLVFPPIAPGLLFSPFSSSLFLLFSSPSVLCVLASCGRPSSRHIRSSSHSLNAGRQTDPTADITTDPPN